MYRHLNIERQANKRMEIDYEETKNIKYVEKCAKQIIDIDSGLTYKDWETKKQRWKKFACRREDSSSRSFVVVFGCIRPPWLDKARKQK